MSWTTSVLVVANVTAGSDELLEAMKARAAKGPTRFTLLVPMRNVARLPAADRPLDAALARMRDAALDVERVVADSDPILASPRPRHSAVPASWGHSRC